jgi:endonuclease/exonuclease/phosphatase family metal-dependent hydrolase
MRARELGHARVALTWHIRPLLTALTTLLVVAALTPALLTQSAAAAQSARNLKVLQFNMAGAALNGGGPAVVDRIVEKVIENDTQVVSLNEICERKQFMLLQQKLAGIGMHGYFASVRIFRAPDCGLNDLLQFDRAGNAVFVRANFRDEASYKFQSSTLGDPRGAACVTAEFEVWTRVCAAHTSKKDGDSRQLAADEVKELQTTLFPAATRRLPFILAGDLNLTPDWPSASSPAIARLYAPEAGGNGDYWEVDQCAGSSPCSPRIGGTATHGEGKLDYIFVSKAHFDEQVSARVEDAGQCDGHSCSDHKMLWGDVKLRLNEPARIFQFNMCGAKQTPTPGCASQVLDNAVPAVVSSILDFKPAVVTLNEVCQSQFQQLRDTLNANGYTVYADFSTTRIPEPKCGNDPLLGGLGNAILSHTQLSNVEETLLPNAGESETYNLTCDETDLRSRTVKVCVTQLSTSADLRSEQAGAVAQHVAGYLDAGFPVIVGGDFEARPWDSALTPMYAHHDGTGQLHEVDETDREYFQSPEYSCALDEPNCRTGEGTVPLPVALQYKYDYIFVSDEFAALDGDATRTSISSHVPLRGWATLTGGDGGTGGGGPITPPPGQNLPPSVSAGPDVSGDEGQQVRLAGSASDPESTPSVTWTYTAGSDVDAGATCSFGDTHAASTTISCTDDGTFYATLTARDGVNAPVSDTARVRLANVPPQVSVTGPVPWSVYRVGTPVGLQASFTDPGTNDTHTCKVNWNDGSSESYQPSGGACDRGHTFAHAGMYTIKATVTDDDGGTSSGEVLVIVYDPDAGFVTVGAQFDSPAGALTADPTATGKAHFEFNPKYKPSDEGPVPGGGKLHFKLDGTGLDLDATSMEWLVVTPDGKAAVKGTGTVAGQSGYGFVLYGYDDPDKLRIVIWPLADSPIPGGTPTYDNRRDAGFDVDVAEPQSITGGSVQIHS